MPASTIGRDPAGDGLTGLEMRLWASPVTPLAFSGEIRGYAVTCTITPYEWTWATGDGASYSAGHHGGPHPGHAAAHTYETRNDYTITLRVLWRRQGSYGLDNVALTQSMDQIHVVEVRSQLGEPGGGRE